MNVFEIIKSKVGKIESIDESFLTEETIIKMESVIIIFKM